MMSTITTQNYSCSYKITINFRAYKDKRIHIINFQMLYRGVKNPAHALNTINDLNYYYGSGVTIDGMYFATGTKITPSYTKYL